MRLFKQAGAEYIVPMAMHHDNFDLWDSKHQRWNSVNMGPKKDIIGMWRAATLNYGLRFGVTTHLARSYSWFQTSHGADKEGPYAGVPYDGADPKHKDLYHETHRDTTRRYPRNPSEAWKQSWFNRIKDLVDQHRPDLLYFDGGVPFGEVGLRMVAHFYNQNMAWHDGRLEAVFNIKNHPNTEHGEYCDGMCVLDMERGMLGDIRELPWQNDTSIGPWFWTDPPDYKSADAIIDAFIDIVSKNGNLLLNVPPKADGTLDAKAEQILVDLGMWMDVNREAISGTRPWTTYGEGPTAVSEGNFKEYEEPFTAEDFRFTTKGNTLYAICLGWPGNGVTATIRSLSTKQELAPIARITLLGHDGEIEWSRDADGLTLRTPAAKPCDSAYSFKIEFQSQ